MSESLQNTVATQTNFDIWQKTLDQLCLQMTRATFETWLLDSRLLSAENGVYTIEAKNDYAKDWLENRLNNTITRTLGDIVGEPVETRFVTNESAGYAAFDDLNGHDEPGQLDAEFEGVYLDRRNAIIQPGRVEVHTQYFRLKWRPLLGPLLSELIRELRQRCYFARGKNPDAPRNTFKTTYRELARALGVSEPTIKRALARDREGNFKNGYLGYFIKEMATLKESGGRGDIRNVGTRFTIYLDEPITPDDEPKLTAVSK